MYRARNYKGQRKFDLALWKGTLYSITKSSTVHGQWAKVAQDVDKAPQKRRAEQESR